MPARLANRGAAVLLAVSLVAAGCSDVAGPPKTPASFIGGVAADEPLAAAAARDILAGGGSAADAAVAGLFAMAVTLPSRASLGAGGACVVHEPGKLADAVLFLPRPPGSLAPVRINGAIVAADRPAAVPMLARGLFALHAAHGSRPIEDLFAPAERMAREGIPAPRALIRDLAVVGAGLSADPSAAATFYPAGVPLAEGALLRQPGLAATFAEFRSLGIGALYQGVLAHRFADAARDAGGGLRIDDLRDALPATLPAQTLAVGGDRLAVPPLPDDGGIATLAAFQALRHAPADTDAATARALAVAARWRQAGGDAASLLSAADLPASNLPASNLPASGLPALPASASLAVVDRSGGAVACAVTMDNLFGTGRIATGTGILLAASPAQRPLPLLTAAIAYDAQTGAFRAAAAGSGQSGAPLAVAAAMTRALAGQAPAPVPEPGRANVVQCPGGLPGDGRGCAWASDPRGAGIALGSASP